ncbi:uncharacterized protein LOC112561038 [Pomacea canaliculata]|uniref:uncharacterized protein LOC112561038 n=1 Tax=Pomacea canaliculata TaxID=400727 RepID=UPI000D73E2BF|nr:uncharacterized protein LOC112561038 [Pomacea canaliculata]
MLMKMWKMGFMRKLYILFLLLLGSSRATDIKLSPCGNDGMREIAADQVTYFTCKVAVKTTVRWNLSVHDTGAHELLALCDGHVCNIWPYDERLFKARSLDSLHTTMAVDARNTSIYNSIHRLNGTLYCYREDGFNRFTIASCKLNYIIPPEDVLCRAVNTSWTVNVSCVIGNLYSSRSIYKCKLLRFKLGPGKESGESDHMLTIITVQSG